MGKTNVFPTATVYNHAPDYLVQERVDAGRRRIKLAMICRIVR